MIVRKTPAKNFAEVARSYALDVAGAKIPACKWVKAAAKRHLDDLESQARIDFEFSFDEQRANAVCTFCELFKHIAGPKAGELLDLEPWQVFIVGSVFGWVRKDSGARRFRKVYIEVPRGNGKSALSSVLGLYGLAADKEQGAQVYSAATTKEQARIVFDTAQAMARRSKGFKSRLGVRVDAHAIVQQLTASVFRPLASDKDSLDGLNIHVAIVDEIHAHKTRGLYDVLETASAKRTQSLIWGITTAGSNQAGISYELRTYLTKILAGTFRDDSFFGLIYTIDEGDDWKDPEIWQKANPNWAVSVVPDVFAQLALKAGRTPSAVNNFKTKHLNVWVNADVSWMDMAAWQRGAEPELTDEDFLAERCWAAVDLASKADLAVAVKLFRRKVEGELHYCAFLKAWLPEASIEKSSNSQYSGWVAQGHIQVTPGNIIDYEEIENDIKSWKDRFEVAAVAYDPFQATYISTRLLGEGFPMVEVGATVKNFSEPMKELEALVQAGRFHHDGNPVFEWMASNVVCHTDKKDNIFPNKQTATNKIDGIVATIMALSRAIADEGEGEAGFEAFVI